MRVFLTLMGTVLTVGATLQDEHPFLGRWISTDGVISLEFSTRAGRENEGSFEKWIDRSGTEGLWEIVGDSVEVFSHELNALTSRDITFVEDPVRQRYAIRVNNDTLLISSDSSSETFTRLGSSTHVREWSWGITKTGRRE